MKRRTFLTTGTLAAAGVAALATTACQQPATADTGKNTNGDAQPKFELEETTIAVLRQQLETGVYTIEQLTQLYLARIAAIDQNGPSLHAVIEVNPDAGSIARQLDEERKAGKWRGPLHGIPVLIKDNIDTGDKMQTTAGALALQGHKAKQDAFLARKLREAGAVILGKTNLSEWANFRSSKSSSGWSGRGGQTKNPYILDHNPCGSSSGSGVAVSANLCAVAIGTETDGSVTCPASVNGVVGLKPTVGLISRSGIIPISATQDTAGPMARTVKDVAVLLSMLTGVDEADPVTKESAGKTMTDYSKGLDANGLKGKRIGIEKKPQGDDPVLHALAKQAIDLLKQQGATIIEIDYYDKISQLGAAELDVLQFEFKDGLNKYLAAAQAPVQSLKAVIDFNIANEATAMPYCKQDILEASEKKGDLNTPAYKEAYQKSHVQARKFLDEIFSTHQLDAICGLTMGPACSIDLVYGDHWGDVFLTQPAAITGYPHISVPGGFAYDLPVGFSFFGPAYSEATLLNIAYAYEQASKHRRVPTLRPAFLA